MEFLPYKFTAKELDKETGLYYYGMLYLDPRYSRWISTDPALGEYIPGIGKGTAENFSSLPGIGGVYNTVNASLYHYAGNNPVKYTDPDGNDIVNSTDKYILGRLEDPIKIGESKIDTLIIPPHSIAYGAFDGARDEEGNYYKVTGYKLFIAIDFEIDSNSNLKIGDFSRMVNDLGDFYKTKKDKGKPDTEKKILSGKKIKGISPDYDRLNEEWEKTFIKEAGDSKSWASKYNDQSQKDLRKKYKIQTFEEIRQFDKMMHDAHIY